MADITLAVNGGIVKKFKDMGDGTHAEVVSSTATFTTGDIEIGAVELKNGADDTRAVITAGNALKVDNSAVTQPVSAASLPLPAGAGTAANQATIITALATNHTDELQLHADIGTTLHADLIAATPAGSNIIGKVGIDQTPGQDSVTVKGAGYSAAVTLTRTADTNAYLANDVIGAATGSTAALTFTNVGAGAGEYMITSVAMEIDAAAVISGETSYRLYLYNVTPPSALGDNAAWDLPSGDRASFLGYVDLGTPIDLGSTLYVETNTVNKQLKLAGTSVFGYLVTNGAYTPPSARVHVITLHTALV